MMHCRLKFLKIGNGVDLEALQQYSVEKESQQEKS